MSYGNAIGDFRDSTEYFSSFGAALQGTDYSNSSTGYAAYIDGDSWLDYHLLETFAQDMDAFRLSQYQPGNYGLVFVPNGDVITTR